MTKSGRTDAVLFDGGSWAPLSPSELIANVLHATGITRPALARKLGVPVAQLEDATRLDGPQLELLRGFYATARESERTLIAPRVPCPSVSSCVHHADGREVLRKLPAASVDAVISDIPYGIGLDEWDVLHGNTNSALLGSSAAQLQAGSGFSKRRKPINGWSAADRQIPTQYREWVVPWAREWLRVLKPGGSAVVFAGRRLVHSLIGGMEEAGFNFRDMIAWLKPRAMFKAQPLSTVLAKRGELGEAERWHGWRVGNLAPAFEPIAWFFKPYDVTIVDNVLDHMVGAMNADRYRELAGTYENVISIGMAPGEGGLHEAQKPVRLMELLIELCVPAGGVVVDPFAGSGSTAVAALRLGRTYVAAERDERSYKTMVERLSAESAPHLLSAGASTNNGGKGAPRHKRQRRK